MQRLDHLVGIGGWSKGCNNLNVPQASHNFFPIFISVA
jgi:hypothetical protein